MHTKSKLWLLMFCAGLITMATFSGTAEASEFLADVVMQGGMMSGDGKVWIKGQKMRAGDGRRGGKNDYDYGPGPGFSMDTYAG